MPCYSNVKHFPNDVPGRDRQSVFLRKRLNQPSGADVGLYDLSDVIKGAGGSWN
jgi:hypothetical protein